MAFEVISLNTWLSSDSDEFKCDSDSYEAIKLPSRGTIRSAGYDFRSPFEIIVNPDTAYVMPTGIKWNPEQSKLLAKTITFEREEKECACRRNDINYEVTQTIHVLNCVLQLYPRSSLGIKYGFTFLNTTPIIDADYYNNPGNEGHILLGFKCSTEFTIHKGDKICQGIIVPYLTYGEEISNTRSGGIGSTGE